MSRVGVNKNTIASIKTNMMNDEHDNNIVSPTSKDILSRNEGTGHRSRTSSNSIPIEHLHISAMGRGHNSTLIMDINYIPFLDKTYFTNETSNKKTSKSGYNSVFEMEEISELPEKSSPMSVPLTGHQSQPRSRSNSQNYSKFMLTSLSKRTSGDFSGSISNSGRTSPEAGRIMLSLQETDSKQFNLNVRVHLDDENLSKDAKILFENEDTIDNVTKKIIQHFDFNNSHVISIVCIDTSAKLEAGTLESNNIKNDYHLELHISNVKNAESLHKFEKTLKPNSIYLSLLYFDSQKHIMMTKNQMLPTLLITDDEMITDEFGADHKDFAWTISQSADWEKDITSMINASEPEEFLFSHSALLQRSSKYEELSKSKDQPNVITSFRYKSAFFKTLATLQNNLGLKKLGYLYSTPVKLKSLKNCHIILAIQFANVKLDFELTKKYGLHRSTTALNNTYFSTNDDEIWALYFQYYGRRRLRLHPGVYVAILRLKITLQNIDVLVLKHNPELIPLTRVILNENDVSSASSSSSPLSQSFSPNTSSYNSPFNSTKALNEVDVLTPTEIEYVKMRAQIDAQKLKSIPESFEVTSRMKMVYEKFKEAAAFLSNEIDPHTPFNMDAITSCSPILLGEDKDIQLFVLATNSDLVLSEHVEEEEKSKRSYFDRLFKKQAISPPPANNTNNRVVEHNVKYFQFENFNLFEALHHNAYNFTNYSNYRREMESLSVKNISSVTKVNQKQKQEQRNVLIELKRKWDLNNSWISQIIEAHKYNQK